MTHVHVVGIGMGPQHLTREAEAVLAGCDYAVAMRKGPGDALLAVRRAICHAAALELVVLEDPARDRDDPADYPRAVRDWHAARTDLLAATLAARGGTAAILAWGDPALYDSSVRLVGQMADRLPLTWSVTPGISAPQALAAAHGIVLHAVGEPVLVTTGRRLGEAIAGGQRSILVMLGSASTLQTHRDALERWTIHWSANLGAPSQRLVAGRVGEVRDAIDAARRAAADEAGWVMDAYLLQAAS